MKEHLLTTLGILAITCLFGYFAWVVTSQPHIEILKVVSNPNGGNNVYTEISWERWPHDIYATLDFQTGKLSIISKEKFNKLTTPKE